MSKDKTSILLNNKQSITTDKTVDELIDEMSKTGGIKHYDEKGNVIFLNSPCILSLQNITQIKDNLYQTHFM